MKGAIITLLVLVLVAIIGFGVYYVTTNETMPTGGGDTDVKIEVPGTENITPPVKTPAE